MPSFLIHSIIGNKLSEKLNFDKKDSNDFIVGNLLPDIQRFHKEDQENDIEYRYRVQRGKILTHFRSNIDDALQYPDLGLFLNKYGDLIKKDKIVFGYFFHLYTDYYYFKYFLPKYVCFYDKDNKETSKIKNNYYAKIKKSNSILNTSDFWNYKDLRSIYKEYFRISKYLLENYDIEIDELKNYIRQNKITNRVLEVNDYDLIESLNGLCDLIKDVKEAKKEELLIFDFKEILVFLEDVIATFLKDYESIID